VGAQEENQAAGESDEAEVEEKGWWGRVREWMGW
jgi:hypothetical protein